MNDCRFPAIATLVFSMLTSAGVLQAAAPADLPNIVFILADDLGYGDLSCQNDDSKITTPHLDRLAAQGMRFTDGHSPDGVCTPTRYGLLTGRYCWRTRLKRGVLRSSSPPLIEADRLTVAGLLKQKGYLTACVGKWHLGRTWTLRDEQQSVSPENIDWSQSQLDGPRQHGFTYFFGLGKPAWTFMENDHVLAPPTEKLDLTHIGPYLIGPNNIRGVKSAGFEMEQMLPTFTGQAVAFIGRAAKADQPFFLYFTPITPHKPIVPNKPFQGKSKAGLYGDFVTELDGSVGRILDALNDHGLSDNTLVVFTSDNGPENIAYDRIQQHQHYSMGKLRGVKRDAWEGGHRVPLLVRWPGKIEPASVSGEVVCLTDLMATAAAAVGFELPDDAAEDSYNLLPVLLGRPSDKPIREATVHHSSKGHFAIRQGDWVYIDAPSGDNNREPAWMRQQRGVVPHQQAGELFRLDEDLAQRENLLEQHPQKVAALKSLLRRYQQQGRSVPPRTNRQ